MSELEKQPSFLGEEAGGATEAKRPRTNRKAKQSEQVSEPRVTTEGRVPTTTTGGGGPGGGGVPRAEEEPEGKEGGKEVTSAVRDKGTRAARGATSGGSRKGGGDEKAGRAGKSEPVYVRLSGAMLEAIEEAVKGSPIEFGDRSEFIRRAVENELRRRGLIGTYK